MTEQRDPTTVVSVYTKNGLPTLQFGDEDVPGSARVTLLASTLASTLVGLAYVAAQHGAQAGMKAGAEAGLRATRVRKLIERDDRGQITAVIDERVLP